MVLKSIVRIAVKKNVYSDRIVAIKLETEPVNILMLQVYMATSEREYEEVAELNDIIEEILEVDGKGNANTIIMGDSGIVLLEMNHIGTLLGHMT